MLSKQARAELGPNRMLLLACVIGYGLGLTAIPFYTLSVFIDPIHRDFGWSVGAIQLGLTVSYLTTILMMPAVAWLVDRYGVRPVALACLALEGLAFMCLGLQDGKLWHFYLNWFFISFFGTGTLAIPWTRAITNALNASRGFGLGISLLGAGLIGIMGPAVAHRLIDAFGWRGAYVCLGAAPLIIGLPVVFLFFHDKHALRSKTKGLPAQFSDIKLILLALTFLLLSTGVTGVIPNLIKILTGGGVSRDDAIFAAGVIGAFIIIGRLFCGVLLDRFWAPGVAMAIVGLCALACTVLALGSIPFAAAVVVCALIGLTVGSEFDLMPYLVSRYMAPERYVSSMAVVSSGFYLGAAISGPSLAYFYDAFGTYRYGLLAAVGLFMLAVLALMSLGPYRLSVHAAGEPELP